MPSSSSNSSDPISDMLNFWSLIYNKVNGKTLFAWKARQILFRFVFAAVLYNLCCLSNSRPITLNLKVKCGVLIIRRSRSLADCSGREYKRLSVSIRSAFERSVRGIKRSWKGPTRPTEKLTASDGLARTLSVIRVVYVKTHALKNKLNKNSLTFFCLKKSVNRLAPLEARLVYRI